MCTLQDIPPPVGSTKAIRAGSYLDADVHEGGVGVHVAGDAAAPHLGHQLQGLAQLLVAAALADEGGVGVHVAKVRQLVPLRQPPQPVEELRSPVTKWIS